MKWPTKVDMLLNNETKQISSDENNLASREPLSKDERNRKDRRVLRPYKGVEKAVVHEANSEKNL